MITADQKDEVRCLRATGMTLQDAKRHVLTQALREEIDTLDAVSTGEDIRAVLHKMLDWMGSQS